MSPSRAEARAAGDDRQQTPNGVERSGQNPLSPLDAGLRFDVANPTAWSDGHGRQSLLETARREHSVHEQAQQSLLETARRTQSVHERGQQSLLESSRGTQSVREPAQQSLLETARGTQSNHERGQQSMLETAHGTQLVQEQSMPEMARMVQSARGDANQQLTRPDETGAIVACVRSYGEAAGMGVQSIEPAALAHFAPSSWGSPDRPGDQVGREGPEAATAWTSPPRVRAGHGHQPNASPLLPFAEAQSPPPRRAPQPATDSSDSVPPDAVQADIQRQLASVMSQLQDERRRSEQALQEARVLRHGLEQMQAAKVQRPEGVCPGVPVYPMTRQFLERLISALLPTDSSAAWAPPSLPPPDLHQPPGIPAGYRASEQAAQPEGDNGHGGILGGLLGVWGRSVPESQTRPPEIPTQRRQSTSSQQRPAEDDSVKRLLDGMERLFNNVQRGETQETVKSASTTSLPTLPGITESAAVDFGDWLHTITNPMGIFRPILRPGGRRCSSVCRAYKAGVGG